jgi:hypothetical protein
MGRWSDLAARLREGEEVPDNRVNSVNSPRPAPIDPIEPIERGSLPSSVLAGLDRLRLQAAPRLERPEVWPEIVADALALVTDGWAGKALALGWTPLQLWGAHLDTPGLAAWLAGRRIALLHDSCCTVADGPNRWAVFNRREPAPGTVFLWEWGRG